MNKLWLAVLAVMGIALIGVQWGRGGDGLWFINTTEDLVDEPIYYEWQGKGYYLLVTTSKAMIVDAGTGSVVAEEGIKGSYTGLGHPAGKPEIYIGVVESNASMPKLSMYRVAVEGLKIRVDGPILEGVDLRTGVTDRGIWTISGGSLKFYRFPGLEGVDVYSPLPVNDSVMLSAATLGRYEIVSIVLANSTSYIMIYDAGDLEPLSIIKDYVAADTIEYDNNYYILAVGFEGENFAQYSMTYLIDVFRIRDGKPVMEYGLTHKNVVNYPPAVEFIGDPYHIIVLSVNPRSENKTGFAGTDPVVAVLERDGDTLYQVEVEEVTGDLPPKTIWTPYTGLSNPHDIDGDGYMEVLATVKLYRGSDRIGTVVALVEVPAPEPP